MPHTKVITRDAKAITVMIEYDLEGSEGTSIDTFNLGDFRNTVNIGASGESGSHPDYVLGQKIADNKIMASFVFTGAKQVRQYLQCYLAVFEDLKRKNKALIPGVKILSASVTVEGLNDPHKIYLSGGEYKSKNDLAKDLAYGFCANLAKHNGLKNKDFTYKKNGIVMYAITDKKKLDDKQDSVPFLTYAEAAGKTVKRKVGWAEEDRVLSRAQKCYNVTLGFDFRGFPDLIDNVVEQWCNDYAKFVVSAQYGLGSIKCYKNGKRYLVEQSFESVNGYKAFCSDLFAAGNELNYTNILEALKILTRDSEFNKPSENLSYETAELLVSYLRLLEYTDLEFQNNAFSLRNLTDGTLLLYKNQSQKVFDDRAKKPSEKIGLMTYVEFKSLAEGYSEITYNDPISTAAVGVDIQTSGISTIKDLEMTFFATGDYKLISYNTDFAMTQVKSFKDEPRLISAIAQAIFHTNNADRGADPVTKTARLVSELPLNERNRKPAVQEQQRAVDTAALRLEAGASSMAAVEMGIERETERTAERDAMAELNRLPMEMAQAQQSVVERNPDLSLADVAGEYKKNII